MEELNGYLHQYSLRLRLRGGWNLIQKTLWITFLIALLIQILGRFIPIAGLGWWTTAPILVWLLASGGYFTFRRLSPMHIARQVDVELGLFERLSTSLALNELSIASTASMPNASPSSLVLAQQQDALQVARTIQPRLAFPLRWQRQPVIISSLLLVVILVTATLPNPKNAILAERAAVRAEAQKQSERIEKLKEEVAKAEGLSEEDRADLQRQLNELAQKLRTNPGDLEQAIADLSKVEEALKQKLDPNSVAKAANLEALASQLSALTNQERDPSQDASQTAADALSQLAEQMASMDSTQRQQLAEALAQMAAQASQAGNADLAQALAEMAQAMQAANAAEAQQNPQAAASAQAAAQSAAQNAAQAASQAQQQLNAQQALQQALSQLQASRQSLSQASSQALAQAGQSNSSGQTGGSGPNSSQAAGQSPSSGTTTGQGATGQGPTSGGGGSNASTLPPATGQGQPNLHPQGSKPVGQESDLSSQVYVPRQQGGSNGDELFIPGQDTGQGETTSSQGQSSLPGTLNPALVPYNNVFYQYLLSANQAMQQSYIPLSLLQYIQAYFLQLEQQQ
jgi:septal ring factor EnvC (AmiA/AmiB activator)